MTDIIIAHENREIGNQYDAIACTGEALFEKGYVKDTFAQACIDREKIFPTGICSEEPVAIPHADAIHVNKSAVCFLRLKNPIEFVRMDNFDETVQTRLVINLAVGSEGSQVEMLKKVVSMLKTKEEIIHMINCNEDELLEYANRVLNGED